MRTRCCIAGGGPAGMMLGVLLARWGIDTVVLEKHADFLRDFRGDTVHPSTLEVIHELGLLEGFLRRPHSKVDLIGGLIGGQPVVMADLRHLPARCPYIAFMPQWDFLDFLADHGREQPGFHLKMQTEAVGLIEKDGRVTGVRTRAGEEIDAELVVAADGRHSLLRQQSGLVVEDFGAPMDVLWLRLSKQPQDPTATLGRIDAGRVFVTLDRGDYWQCAFVIAKGQDAVVRARGLEAFHAEIAAIAPFLAQRVGEIRDWNEVKLLTVQVNRLARWHRPGLLCIGDAAHAMSPIGGVGINLAIQDAVAAANVLVPAFRAGQVGEAQLAAIQQRREFPTRMTQRMQLFLQSRVISRVLAGGRRPGVAWPIRLMQWFPMLRRLPARVMGLGFRPEHVRLPPE